MVDAVIHSRRIVPVRKTGHLEAIAPCCFGPDTSGEDLRDRSRRLFERAGWSKRNELRCFVANDLYREFPPYIGNLPRNDVVRYAWPKFTAETTLYGDFSAHALLRPALPEAETYRAKGARLSLSCVVDTNRRQAASESLARATGCTLGEAVPGAPRKPSASSAALRMREYRERKKAGRHTSRRANSARTPKRNPRR